jgi:hypothetical protein
VADATHEEWTEYTHMAFASALFGIADPNLATSPILLAFKEGFDITLSSESTLLDVSRIQYLCRLCLFTEHTH